MVARRTVTSPRRSPAACGRAGQVYWAAKPENSRQRRGCEMAAKERFTKASEAARAAQRNRYVQRLLEDEDLRGTLLTAWGAARSAYGRMSNGEPAAQALSDDRKLRRERKAAAKAIRDAWRMPPRPARRR